MSGTTSIMRFSQDIASAEAPPPLPARQYRAEVSVHLCVLLHHLV